MKSPAVLRAWSLAVFWTSIIALESFEGSSANTAYFLWPVFHFVFPAMTIERFEVVHEILRKTGHFLGYGTLSFVFYRAWWTTLKARACVDLSWRTMFKSWSGRAVVLALLGTLAIAGLDEWHQSMEPGRGPSLRDVALDETGGAVAIALLWGKQSISRREREVVASS